MRFMALTAALLLVQAVAGRADQLSRAVATTTVPADTETNSVFIAFAEDDGAYGYIEKLTIFVTNAVDVDVDLTMSNVYNHVTETVYSVDDLAASVALYPRINTCDTSGTADSNAWQRIVMAGDKIECVVTDPATNYVGNTILFVVDYLKVGR